MEERDYIVDGFVFHSERDAKRARRELDGVRYVRENGNLDDPQKLLQVYNRLIEQGLFETPIGIRFLKELQDKLRKTAFVSEDMITPIDTGNMLIEPQETKPENKEKKKGRFRRAKKEKVGSDKKDDPDETGNTASDPALKTRFTVSLIINIALVILVGAMIVIATTTKSPTVLNYENELIDRYEEWDKELQDREEAIRQYEEKYGIDSSDVEDEKEQ